MEDEIFEQLKSIDKKIKKLDQELRIAGVVIGIMIGIIVLILSKIY